MMRILLGLWIILSMPWAQAASPTTGSLFTYEGVLTDVNGNPITSTQSVTFQILYGTCIVYEELQNITPGASGEFSAMIGAGSRQDSTGNTADRIFASTGTVNCSGSSAVSVSGFATRSLHIRVGGTDLFPDVTLGNMPFAINAMKLADRDASEFLLKTGIPTCAAGTYLSFDGTSLTCSSVTSANLNWSSISSGKPTSLSGYGITDAVQNAGNAPSIQSGTDSSKPVSPMTGAIYIATDTSKIYQFNSVAWNVVASGAGGTLTALTGDVTASGAGSVVATVNSVGGSTAANLHSAEVAVNAATNTNTASTLVKRDAAGNFSAGTISANLTGSVTGNVTGSASLNVLKTGDTMTGNLSFASGKGVSFTDSTANTVSLQAPSTVTSYILKLPPAQGAANQLLTNDGAGNLSWTSFSSLGVTATTVTAPIINTGTASSPNIGINPANGSQNGYLSSADWNTFNNKMSNSLTSANIWVGNGSNVATAVAPNGDVVMTNGGTFLVTGLRGTAISNTAPFSAGQVLRYDGTTSYLPGFLGLADIRATITPFGGAFANAACSAAQSLYWQSSTDTFQCQNISINDNQVNFVSSRPANTVLAAPNGAAGAPSFRTLASTDLPTTGTNGVFINGGNSFGTASSLGTNDSFPLSIKTNNLIRLNIDPAGNIGAGTTTPVSEFELQRADTNVSLTVTNTNSTSARWPALRIANYAGSTSGSYPRLLLNNSRGSISSKSPLADGDTLGSLEFYGQYDASPSTAGGSVIGVYAKGAWSATNSGLFLTMSTAPAGSFTVPVERVRITDTGRVGIGTTIPAATLDVAGHIGSTGGIAPTALSGGCSINAGSTDTRGTITVPTASISGGYCSFSFAVAFTSSPYCVVSWTTPPTGANLGVTATSTNFTLNFTGSATAQTSITYHCLQ